MAKIQPNCSVYGLGFAVLKIWDDRAAVKIWCNDCDQEETYTIDPEQAPLFRMLANRLDEISGKRKRRG